MIKDIWASPRKRKWGVDITLGTIADDQIPSIKNFNPHSYPVHINKLPKDSFLTPARHAVKARTQSFQEIWAPAFAGVAQNLSFSASY